MSTGLPWRSDRPLDAARVDRIVAAQFPHLAPARATFLAEGWDSDVYVVAESWILRFPKRREVEAGQDIERTLLPRLAPTLPLRIPEPSLFGEPSADFPFRFLGYRRLAGTSAEDFPIDAVDVRHCADAFAVFLSSLHAFPVSVARALGVPERRTPDPTARRNKFLEAWADVGPVASTDLHMRTERYFAAEPSPAAYLASCLVHGDLLPDHILVDPDGRVTGVIDWGDAALGDPAADFAACFVWLGEGFAQDVFSRYLGDRESDVLARARRRAAWSSLLIASAGVRGSRPIDVSVGLRGLDLSLPG